MASVQSDLRQLRRCHRLFAHDRRKESPLCLRLECQTAAGRKTYSASGPRAPYLDMTLEKLVDWNRLLRARKLRFVLGCHVHGSAKALLVNFSGGMASLADESRYARPAFRRRAPGPIDHTSKRCGQSGARGKFDAPALCAYLDGDRIGHRPRRHVRQSSPDFCGSRWHLAGNAPNLSSRPSPDVLSAQTLSTNLPPIRRPKSS